MVWEVSEAKSGPKLRCFEKALPKRWRYRCFCLFLLVAMENVIIEFVGIYDVLCMCFLKTM